MNTYSDLRKVAKQMLTEEILPFWLRLRDDENGGFFGYVDNISRIDKEAPKGVILHSRILYTFADAYRVTGRDEYLRASDHAYRFLVEKALDPSYGGLYWMLDYAGEPLQDFKHSYNQAFGIYALSTYALAGGEPKALSYAMDLFRLLEAKWRTPTGYREQLSRDYLPVSNEELSENGIIADRTMNTVLHIMEAYTVLFEATQDADVLEALRYSVACLTESMYNKERVRLDVFFDTNLVSLLDLHSYGHDIEASWLIDRAVATIGDDDLRDRTAPTTKALYDHVMRKAYTTRGVYFECENGRDDTKRDWWVQAEAVVGIINDAGREKFPPAHLLSMAAILEYIGREIKAPSGEWYWTTYENGSHDEKRELAGPWKCPYHNGRMCIEMMRRIRA